MDEMDFIGRLPIVVSILALIVLLSLALATLCLLRRRVRYLVIAFVLNVLLGSVMFMYVLLYEQYVNYSPLPWGYYEVHYYYSFSTILKDVVFPSIGPSIVPSVSNGTLLAVSVSWLSIGFAGATTFAHRKLPGRWGLVTLLALVTGFTIPAEVLAVFLAGGPISFLAADLCRGRKQCPICFKHSDERASKCPYCHTHFPEVTSPRPKYSW